MNRKKIYREMGIEFSFVGKQRGRERKRFWLSDPLIRPKRRTAEKKERKRVWYFGYCFCFTVCVVVISVLASVW